MAILTVITHRCDFCGATRQSETGDWALPAPSPGDWATLPAPMTNQQRDELGVGGSVYAYDACPACFARARSAFIAMATAPHPVMAEELEYLRAQLDDDDDKEAP